MAGPRWQRPEQSRVTARQRLLPAVAPRLRGRRRAGPGRTAEGSPCHGQGACRCPARGFTSWGLTGPGSQVPLRPREVSLCLPASLPWLPRTLEGQEEQPSLPSPDPHEKPASDGVSD